MARFVYDASLVSMTLDKLNEAYNELENTETEIDRGVSMICSATGSELMDIDFSPILNYFVQVTGGIDDLSTNIKNTAQQIEDYQNAPWHKKLFSTLGMTGLKLVEGIGGVIENLGDGLVSIAGFAGGLFNSEFKDACAEFVKKDYVGDTFSNAYESGALQNINKYSIYSHESTAANIFKGFGTAAAYVGISLVTGGASLAKEVAIEASIAAVTGIGQGTQDGLQAGKTFNSAFGEGLKTGVMAAAGEAVMGVAMNKIMKIPEVQNAIGSVIQKFGKAKAKFASKITKNTDEVVTAMTVHSDEVVEAVTKSDNILKAGKKTDEIIEAGAKVDEVVEASTKTDNVLAAGKKSDEVLEASVKADEVVEASTKTDGQYKLTKDEIIQDDLAKGKAKSVETQKVQDIDVTPVKQAAPTQVDEVVSAGKATDEVVQPAKTNDGQYRLTKDEIVQDDLAKAKTKPVETPKVQDIDVTPVKQAAPTQVDEVVSAGKATDEVVQPAKTTDGQYRLAKDEIIQDNLVTGKSTTPTKVSTATPSTQMDEVVSSVAVHSDEGAEIANVIGTKTNMPSAASPSSATKVAGSLGDIVEDIPALPAASSASLVGTTGTMMRAGLNSTDEIIGAGLKSTDNIITKTDEVVDATKKTSKGTQTKSTSKKKAKVDVTKSSDELDEVVGATSASAPTSADLSKVKRSMDEMGGRLIDKKAKLTSAQEALTAAKASGADDATLSALQKQVDKAQKDYTRQYDSLMKKQKQYIEMTESGQFNKIGTEGNHKLIIGDEVVAGPNSVDGNITTMRAKTELGDGTIETRPNWTDATAKSEGQINKREFSKLLDEEYGPVKKDPSPKPSDNPDIDPNPTKKPDINPEPTKPIEPEPTKTVAPEPTKTVEPEPTKTVEPEPTKTVEPEPTKTVEPEPTKTVEPEPTKTVEPEPTKTVEPEPTKTVEPEPTKTVEPEPTKTVEPEPTKTVEPEPTKTVEPEPTKTVEPEPTKTVEPEPTKTVEPEPTKTVEPEPTKTVEPEPTKTVEPEPTKYGEPGDSETLYKHDYKKVTEEIGPNGEKITTTTELAGTPQESGVRSIEYPDGTSKTEILIDGKWVDADDVVPPKGDIPSSTINHTDEIADVVEEVGTHTDEASDVIEEVSTHTDEAADAVEEVGTHTDEASDVVEEVSTHTDETADVVEKVGTHTDEAADVVEEVGTHTDEFATARKELETRLDDINSQKQVASETIETLQKRSDELQTQIAAKEAQRQTLTEQFNQGFERYNYAKGDVANLIDELAPNGIKPSRPGVIEPSNSLAQSIADYYEQGSRIMQRGTGTLDPTELNSQLQRWFRSNAADIESASRISRMSGQYYDVSKAMNNLTDEYNQMLKRLTDYTNSISDAAPAAKQMAKLSDEITQLRGDEFTLNRQIRQTSRQLEGLSKNADEIVSQIDELKIKPTDTIDEVADVVEEVGTHTDEAAYVVEEVSTHTDEATDVVEEVGTHTDEAADVVEEVGTHTDEAADVIEEVGTHTDEAADVVEEVGTHTDEALETKTGAESSKFDSGLEDVTGTKASDLKVADDVEVVDISPSTSSGTSSHFDEIIASAEESASKVFGHRNFDEILEPVKYGDEVTESLFGENPGKRFEDLSRRKNSDMPRLDQLQRDNYYYQENLYSMRKKFSQWCDGQLSYEDLDSWIYKMRGEAEDFFGQYKTACSNAINSGSNNFSTRLIGSATSADDVLDLRKVQLFDDYELDYQYRTAKQRLDYEAQEMIAESFRYSRDEYSDIMRHISRKQEILDTNYRRLKNFSQEFSEMQDDMVRTYRKTVEEVRAIDTDLSKAYRTGQYEQLSAIKSTPTKTYTTFEEYAKTMNLDGIVNPNGSGIIKLGDVEIKATPDMIKRISSELGSEGMSRVKTGVITVNDLQDIQTGIIESIRKSAGDLDVSLPNRPNYIQTLDESFTRPAYGINELNEVNQYLGDISKQFSGETISQSSGIVSKSLGDTGMSSKYASLFSDGSSPNSAAIQDILKRTSESPKIMKFSDVQDLLFGTSKSTDDLSALFKDGPTSPKGAADSLDLEDLFGASKKADELPAVFDDSIKTGTNVVEEVATHTDEVADVVEEVATHTDEVADVVEEVATHTDEVADVVEEVATHTDEVADVVEEVATHTDEVADVIEEVGTHTDEVADVIEEVGTHTDEVADVIEEVGTHTDEVADVIEEVGTHTDEVADAVEEVGTHTDEAVSASKAAPQPVDEAITPSRSEELFASQSKAPGNAEYIEESSIFSRKNNAKNIFKGNDVNAQINVTPQAPALTELQQQWVDYLNYEISMGRTPVALFNSTTEISSAMLSKIDDLSQVKIQLLDGLGDGNGMLKPKYNAPQYIDRVTYSGHEMNAIVKRLEQLQSKIDMSLPPSQRAKQIYDILSTEVPVMHDFDSIPNGHKISASLRGLTPVNSAGKEGLVCAGYSSVYKELCERADIACDYIRGKGCADPLRGGRPGGHAWNVVHTEIGDIPVDVTWSACNNGSNKWFGASEDFASTHWSNSDELYQDFSSSSMTPRHTIGTSSEKMDNVVSILEQKYGSRSEALSRLESYVNSGDPHMITRTDGARDIVLSTEPSYVQNYVYYARQNNSIQQIVDTMNYKNGNSTSGYYALRRYLETGNSQLITRTNGARDLLSSLDPNIIDQFLTGLGW